MKKLFLLFFGLAFFSFNLLSQNWSVQTDSSNVITVTVNGKSIPITSNNLRNDIYSTSVSYFIKVKELNDINLTSSIKLKRKYRKAQKLENKKIIDTLTKQIKELEKEVLIKLNILKAVINEETKIPK